MNWEKVLFYIGLLNGLLAYVNARLFIKTYNYTPLLQRIIVLCVVFLCSTSFFTNLPYAWK